MKSNSCLFAAITKWVQTGAVLSLFVCGVVLPTTAVAETPAVKAEAAPAKHFGGAFTMTESQKIGEILAAPDKFDNKLVKVEATVKAVCKKKGCWAVVTDPQSPEKTVRITMKDYGFFLPKDCDGKRVVVEGTFARKVITEAQLRHFAQDAGKDPSEIKGDQEELSLVATAIDLLD